MDLKLLQILCLTGVLISVNADTQEELTDHLDKVARLAFKKLFPAHKFDELLAQNIRDDAVYLAIRSESHTPNGDPEYSFTCHLKVKQDSIDTLVTDPQILMSTCKENSRHLSARNGSARNVFLVHNVTEEEMGLINDLANFAAEKLDEIDADNRKNIVEEVVNPTKQFAGGIKYEFTLKLSETDCPEESEDIDACKAKAGKSTKWCNVKILRTWASKLAPHATLVESQCEREYESLFSSPRKPKKFDFASSGKKDNGLTKNFKKKLIGSSKEIDIKDEEVQKYANMSVLSILPESKYRSNLIRVLHAQAQVVSGLLYFLKLEVGQSKCLKTDPIHADCNKDNGEHKICSIQVWVPESKDLIKFGDASCEDKPTSNRRMKRSPTTPTGLLHPESVDDPTVKKYAELVLSGLKGVSGSNDELKLEEIVKAQSEDSQGVSEKNYHLNLRFSDASGPKTCTAVVKQPSDADQQPEVTNIACLGPPLYQESKSKRSTHLLLGGPSPVSVDDKDVQKYAAFSLATLESQSGSTDKLKLEEVIEASTQVVSGTLYHIKLIVSSASGGSKICEVKVWVQPWLHHKEVTDASCENKPSNRKKRSLGLLGGPQSVSVDDKDVQKYAKLSLTKLESLSGSNDKLNLVEVIEAYTQVVSGTNYIIKLRVSSANGGSKVCNVQVWVQSWLNKEEVKDASCEDKPSDEEKQSLQTFGGLQPINVTNEQVQKYAKFSLAKLESLSGSNDKLNLVEVIEAHSQVVSGTKYHIKMRVSSANGGSKVCNVQVWVQSWLNKEEVTDASCEDKPFNEEKQSLQTFGGLQPINVTNEQVQKYAKFSLAKLESLSGFNDKLNLVEVIEAHSQVVSGTKYHIKLRVSSANGDSKICNVKVWVQSWLNKEEVTDAYCEDKPSDKKKRSPQTLGGPQPINVTNEEVQKYAKLSLAKLESLSGSNDKLNLVEVIEAQTQVVSGTKYLIKLRVSSANGDSKICNVQVWVQSWLNKEEVTDAYCEDKPSDKKKQSPGIPGGLSPVSVDDKDVQKYAKLSLTKLESLSGSNDKLKVVEVIEAYTQVVSGSLYHIKLRVSNALGSSKTCNVKVWVQSWLKKEEVTDASCEDKPSDKKKRQAVPGGLSPVSVDDKDVQKYAKLSLAKLESLSGSSDKLNLVEVIDAQKQVVSGAKYYIKLRVSSANGDSKICNVQVWVQSWLNKEEVTDAYCEDKPSNRKKRSPGVKGGLSPVSVDDEDVQKYAKFSLSTLESQSGSKDKLKFEEVIEAQKQVVSGTKYHIKLRVSSANGGSKICNVKVWVQPWLNKEEVQDASCEDKPSNRKKRQAVPGGLSPVSVDDKDVQKYAKLSLAKLESLSGSSDKLNLVEVIDAQKQVVSGAKYYIKLRVSSANGDSKICNVQVWVQSWLNKEEVTDAYCEDKPSNRKKRQADLPGGLSPVSVDDQDIQKYAKLSLAKLESQSGSSDKLNLVEVIEARKQVVSGFKYHIKLRVSSANGDSKICNVQVWVQSWLKKEEVTDAYCEDKPSDKKKRSPGVKGGLSPVSVDDEDVQKHAKFSLSTLESLSGSKDKLKFVEVIEAQKQVVSGLMYHIKLRVSSANGDSKICNVQVWVQSWLKKEEVTYASCEDKPSNRKKRSPGVKGGLSPVSVDDEDVQKHAKFSLSTLESLSGSKDKLKFVEVIEAQKQVVSGLMYHIKLRVSSANGDSKICNVQVWVQSWLKKEEVTYASCEDKPSNRKKRSPGSLGGLVPISVDNKDVQKYAKLSLTKLESLSVPNDKLKVVEVIEAYTQVVAGTKYHIKLRVSSYYGGSGSKICNVKVWVQDWIGKEEVTDFSCEDKPSNRKKRSPDMLVGAPQSASVGAKDIEEYALFSLAHLEGLSEPRDKLKLEEVIEAKTQVVAGILYDLKLRVSSSNGDSKTCHVKVWVRSWLNQKEVTEASCEDKPSSRKKRSQSMLVCGQVALDINDHKVEKYARNSISSLEGLIGSPQQLVKVVDAHVQVSSGLLYLLKIEIVPVKCLEDDCSKESKICDVKIWVQESLKNERVTDAHCQDKESTYNKRSYDSNFGDIQKVNVDDDKVNKYAQVAIESIAEVLESDYKLELIRVMDARVKTVSGHMYSLKLEVGHQNCSKSSTKEESGDCSEKLVEPKICYVKVWVQEWLNSIKVTEAVCDGVSVERRRREQDKLVEGIERIDVEDEKVQKYVQESLETLEDQSDSKLALKRVIDANVQTKNCLLKGWVVEWLNTTKRTDAWCEDQALAYESNKVVPGLFYSIKLEVEQSKCSKSELNSGIDCAKDLIDTKICHVKLWVVEWINTTKTTDVWCEGKPLSAERSKRLTVSEGQRLDVKSEEMVRKSKEILPELFHHFSSGAVLSLNQTIEARVQVVNGALYTFILEVVVDEPCGTAKSSACSDKKTHHETRKFCSVKVLEKDWLNYSEVVFSKCVSNLDQIRKV